EADRDRKFGAVLAQPVEFESGPHRPCLRCADIAGSVADMAAPVAFGNQHLDLLADQFLAAIAEQQLGLRVDELNLSLIAGDQNRVWSGLQEVAEARLAGAQIAFGLRAGRDVADDRSEEDVMLDFRTRQGEIDGKLPAIPVAPDEFDRLADDVRFPSAQISLQSLRMRLMKPLGHEQ